MQLVEIDQDGVRLKFYVHNRGDVASDEIRRSGKVYCPQQIIDQMVTARQQGRVLRLADIGSNIGSCAVLGGALGHKVWAFEPVPPNYKALAQSVVINNLQDSVQLVPCAAGNTSFSSVINVLDGNYGHSMVGAKQPLPEFNYTSETIHVIRADKALGATAIDLMKIDVEGYEFQAIQGLAELFSDEVRKPKYVLMEYSPHLLRLQGVNPAYKVLWLLHNHGYDLSYAESSTPINAAELHKVDRTNRDFFDIIAQLRGVAKEVTP